MYEISIILKSSAGRRTKIWIIHNFDIRNNDKRSLVAYSVIHDLIENFTKEAAPYNPLKTKKAPNKDDLRKSYSISLLLKKNSTVEINPIINHINSTSEHKPDVQR